MDSDEENKYYVFTVGKNENSPRVDATMEGRSIRFFIDSGADVNLIHLSTFQTLKNRRQLDFGDAKIYSYLVDEPLPVLGRFRASIEANGHRVNAMFELVEGRLGNLLGFETARELDLFNTAVLRLKPESLLRRRNALKVWKKETIKI